MKMPECGSECRSRVSCANGMKFEIRKATLTAWSYDKGMDDALHKIIPSHDIFRNVFHGILQEEPIFVAEYWSLTVFKGNFIYRVTERKFFGVLGNSIQMFPVYRTHHRA